MYSQEQQFQDPDQQLQEAKKFESSGFYLTAIANYLEVYFINKSPLARKKLGFDSIAFAQINPNISVDKGLSAEDLSEKTSKDLLQEGLELFSGMNNNNFNPQKGFLYIKAAAEHDHIGALLILGDLYREFAKNSKDNKVKEQYHKIAFQYYSRTAANNYAPGIYAVGYCHEHGLGTPKNISQALMCYKSASERGYSLALNNFGLYYKNGTHGYNKDLDKAVEYFSRSEAQGCAEGQNNLGLCHLCYRHGEVMAAINFKKAAEQGYAEGQNNLAQCYEQGLGVKQDLLQAAYWYQQSATQGNAEGQHNLARCCEQGLGVKQDLLKAAYWYQLSAKQGNAVGQRGLGLCYFHGKGVNKNSDDAVILFLQSAKQGDAQAEYYLGLCFDRGMGVKQNWQAAIAWYHRAANQGHITAQVTLGNIYKAGDVVPKNLNTAIDWYKKAAEHKDVSAKQLLFNVYLEDETKNFTEALKLYKEIKSMGTYPEIKNIDFLQFAEVQGETSFQIQLARHFKSVNDWDNAFKYYDLVVNNDLSVPEDEVSALYELSYCYEHGLGVRKDLNQASRWHSKGEFVEKNLKEEQLQQLIFDINFGNIKNLKVTLADFEACASPMEHPLILILKEFELNINRETANLIGTSIFKKALTLEDNEAFELRQVMPQHCVLFPFNVDAVATFIESQLHSVEVGEEQKQELIQSIIDLRQNKLPENIVDLGELSETEKNCLTELHLSIPDLNDKNNQALAKLTSGTVYSTSAIAPETPKAAVQEQTKSVYALGITHFPPAQDSDSVEEKVAEKQAQAPVESPESQEQPSIKTPQLKY